MTLHTIISYGKSITRFVACLLALTYRSQPSFAIALFAVGLGIAEILGILEELPGAYKGTQVSNNGID